MKFETKKEYDTRIAAHFVFGLAYMMAKMRYSDDAITWSEEATRLFALWCKEHPDTRIYAESAENADVAISMLKFWGDKVNRYKNDFPLAKEVLS